MSYHKNRIHKHDYKSPFKLIEESHEFIDSLSQNNKIMALVELSDLYGAIEYQANKLGATMKDLEIMANATKSAFKSSRHSFDLYEYLYKNAKEIKEFGLGFIQVKIDNINYNFYTDEVETFSNANQPHNHQLAFTSEILHGELTEHLYDVQEDDNGIILQCACGDISKESKKLNNAYRETITHKKGDIYFRDSNEFHTVKALSGTITKVVKNNEDKIDAFVFGTPEYDYKQSSRDLWTIVKDMIKDMYDNSI